LALKRSRAQLGGRGSGVHNKITKDHRREL